MDYTIIDAHAHLWLRQDVDGVNSAEVFLSNMDYARVSAAVITQESIDGIQNEVEVERTRASILMHVSFPDTHYLSAYRYYIQ